MSDQEKFLARWSRRKRTAEQEAEPNRTSTAGSPECADQPDTAAKPETLPAEPGGSFDASTLPPIESIDAASDIRPFLAPGVPAEMTRAALRRAWSADPVIRDFVGLSENAWDFNATVAVHGFDALEPAEIAELAKHFLQGQQPSAHAEPDRPTDGVAARKSSTAEPTDDSSGSQQPMVALAEATPPHTEVIPEDAMLHRDTAAAFVPKEPANSGNIAPTGPRTHGRALPK